MKKLLTILASFSLTVSTGLLDVACFEPTDEIDNTPVDPKVEKEFKDELASIPIKIAQKLDNRKKYSQVINNSTDEQYNFFNLGYLKTKFPAKVNNDDNDWIDLKNNSEAKVGIISDLKKLFTDEEYILMLDEAFGNNNSYRNMYLGGSQTLGDFYLNDGSNFRIMPQSLDGELLPEFNRTNSSSKEIKDVLYSIDLTFYRMFNHNNREKEPVTLKSTPKQLTLTISTNGVFAATVQNIIKELPNKILHSESSPNRLKFSTLKAATKEETSFKNYGDLAPGIKSYIVSNSFQNDLKETIQTIVTAGPGSKGIIALTPLQEGDLTMESTNTMLDYTDTKSVKNLKNFYDNPLVNSLILKKENGQWMKKQPAIKALQTTLDRIDDNYDDFNKELETFLEGYTIENSEISPLVLQTYSYGTFKLENAEITVTIDKKFVSLPLATINLPWIYTNDEKDDLNENKVDTFFYAMFSSLKEVNKTMLQMNNEEKQLLNTMLTMSSKALKADYSGTEEWKKSWVDIKNDLDKKNVIDINNDYTNVSKNNTKHFSIGTSSKDKKVLKELEKNPYFKFEGFNSYWDIPDFQDKMVLRKTSNNHYGIGFNDKAFDENGIELTYVINLGKMQVNLSFPFGEINNAWDESSYKEYTQNSNFFGGTSRSEETYISLIKDNINNFLFFEF